MAKAKTKFAPSPKKKNDSTRLSTDGLDKSSVVMTTKEVSADQLHEDFAKLSYNLAQLEAGIPEKRLVKILKKSVSWPFAADDKYPLKNDVERMYYLTLEELRATQALRAEIMWNDLKAAEAAKAGK